MVDTLPRRLAVAAMWVLSSGCFSYVPAELDTVPPGEDVRLFLTRQGMDALSEADVNGTLTTGAPVVNGELMRRNPDELYVRIPIARRQIGFHTAQLGQDIRIPTGEIVQIEQRRLNGVGTGLLLAGSAGLVSSIVMFILNDARGTSGGPPIEVEETRIPLISIRF